jgi:hypothetical protein
VYGECQCGYDDPKLSKPKAEAPKEVFYWD